MADSSVLLPQQPPFGPDRDESHLRSRMNKGPGLVGGLVFGAVLLGGLVYTAGQIVHDLSGNPQPAVWPYVLLGFALLIALGFEFVNGFHDTANAVATVIYTHSLEPHIAVVWSGMWNLIGVLTSAGGVAYTIVSLLPVELILQVGSGAGFAMIFALLIAAILWNLGTWFFGLPVSSSHTLIGSIIGVGMANQMLQGHSGTSGVDWGQAMGVFRALVVSPIVGFGFAALMLLLLKLLVRKPELYEAPKTNEAPPFWIRCLLILTCTGVSFGHGSNDGQKGMGLIMLILIGTVPTAYALNHAVGYSQVQTFAAVSDQAQKVFGAHAEGATVPAAQAHNALVSFVRDKHYSPATMAAIQSTAALIEQETLEYKTLANVPAGQQRNVRNDMYLESEALRLINKNQDVQFSGQEGAIVNNYRSTLDRSTKFIPSWVKVAVALALGLGTMVGWKRIVITVGEKIGKTHLTYAQGASAEIVAAATIIAADQFKLPVSTTHVLSSAVAGTMLANGSGLQWATIRNIALAWVVTLPAAAVLSGLLFALIRSFLH